MTESSKRRMLVAMTKANTFLRSNCPDPAGLHSALADVAYEVHICLAGAEKDGSLKVPPRLRKSNQVITADGECLYAQ